METGSFWHSCYLPVIPANVENSVSSTLSRSHVSLESVLDCDDLFVELQANDEQLLNYLTLNETMKKLIKLATSLPPEDASQNRAFKYPFLATEILCSDNSAITQSLCTNRELLEMLCSFLNDRRSNLSAKDSVESTGNTASAFGEAISEDAVIMTKDVDMHGNRVPQLTIDSDKKNAMQDLPFILSDAEADAKHFKIAEKFAHVRATASPSQKVSSRSHSESDKTASSQPLCQAVEAKLKSSSSSRDLKMLSDNNFKEVSAFESFPAASSQTKELENDLRTHHNPVLQGYFCRMLTCLYSRSPKEVAIYLRESPTYLSILIKSICYRSMAELVKDLLLPKDHEAAVFAPEQALFALMSQLLQTPEDKENEDSILIEERHENIAMIIRELIQSKWSLFHPIYLITLASKTSSDWLIACLKSRHESSVHAAVQILTALCHLTSVGTPLLYSQEEAESDSSSKKPPKMMNCTASSVSDFVFEKNFYDDEDRIEFVSSPDFPGPPPHQGDLTMTPPEPKTATRTEDDFSDFPAENNQILHGHSSNGQMEKEQQQMCASDSKEPLSDNSHVLSIEENCQNNNYIQNLIEEEKLCLKHLKESFSSELTSPKKASSSLNDKQKLNNGASYYENLSFSAREVTLPTIEEIEAIAKGVFIDQFILTATDPLRRALDYFSPSKDHNKKTEPSTKTTKLEDAHSNTFGNDARTSTAAEDYSSDHPVVNSISEPFHNENVELLTSYDSTTTAASPHPSFNDDSVLPPSQLLKTPSVVDEKIWMAADSNQQSSNGVDDSEEEEVLNLSLEKRGCSKKQQPFASNVIELQNGARPRIGIACLQLLTLLKNLMKTSSKALCLLTNDFLQQLLDLLYQNKWNTMLHLCIAEIFHLIITRSSIKREMPRSMSIDSLKQNKNAISSSETLANDVLARFLSQTNFLELLSIQCGHIEHLTSHERQDRHHVQQRKEKSGYLWHFIHLGQQIVLECPHYPYHIRRILTQSQYWIKNICSQLQRHSSMLSQPLGGSVSLELGKLVDPEHSVLPLGLGCKADQKANLVTVQAFQCVLLDQKIEVSTTQQLSLAAAQPRKSKSKYYRKLKNIGKQQQLQSKSSLQEILSSFESTDSKIGQFDDFNFDPSKVQALLPDDTTTNHHHSDIILQSEKSSFREKHAAWDMLFCNSFEGASSSPIVNEEENWAKFNIDDQNNFVESFSPNDGATTSFPTIKKRYHANLECIARTTPSDPFELLNVKEIIRSDEEPAAGTHHVKGHEEIIDVSL